MKVIKSNFKTMIRAKFLKVVIRLDWTFIGKRGMRNRRNLYLPYVRTSLLINIYEPTRGLEIIGKTKSLSDWDLNG